MLFQVLRDDDIGHAMFAGDHANEILASFEEFSYLLLPSRQPEALRSSTRILAYYNLFLFGFLGEDGLHSGFRVIIGPV